MVGASETAAASPAPSWDPGAGMQPIATPNTLSGFSSANAIGPDGTSSARPTTAPRRSVSFVKPASRSPTSTPPIPEGTGWDLGSARDINNRGQIVGNGILNGESRAYLLTPTQP